MVPVNEKYQKLKLYNKKVFKSMQAIKRNERLFYLGYFSPQHC